MFITLYPFKICNKHQAKHSIKLFYTMLLIVRVWSKIKCLAQKLYKGRLFSVFLQKN